MECTILIPTLNRIQNIKKILEYYSFSNFKGVLNILDSSEDKFFKINSSNIKKQKNLNVIHEKIYGRPWQVINHALNNVKTKYSLYSGDDDYYVPSTVQNCIAFLEKNNDFIGAHGFSLLAILDKNNNKKILDTDVYSGLGIMLNKKTSFDRFKFLINRYSTSTFSVLRTDIFRKAFNSIPKELSATNKTQHINTIERAINDELLINFLICCFGKIYYKKDSLYLVRTVIFDNSKKNFRKINREDEVAINNFINILSQNISDLDKLELGKVQLEVSTLFNRFIKNHEKKYLNKRPFIYNLMLSFLNKLKKNQHSLKNLLKKEHIYFNDFDLISKFLSK